MSLTIKQRHACRQMSDAAELQRQASLARMADRLAAHEEPEAGPWKFVLWVIAIVGVAVVFGEIAL